MQHPIRAAMVAGLLMMAMLVGSTAGATPVVDVSLSRDAEGQKIAASVYGNATGPIALSGAGNATSCQTSTCVAVSGTGNSSGRLAVSGTGDAHGGSLLGIEAGGISLLGTCHGMACVNHTEDGNATAYWLALAPDGNATAFVAIAGAHDANGRMLAASRDGDATCTYGGCTAASVFGTSRGHVAVSVFGDAYGETLGVSARGVLCNSILCVAP